jgi:hypothetical protein
MCHTVPPRLNKFGVAFKENGFELPPGTVLPESEVYGNQVLSNEEPKAIVGAGFPFMIRTGLTADISTSNTAANVTTNNRFLGIAPGEFGMIGAGSMETAIGGLGFWIDAPFAGAGGGAPIPVISNGVAIAPGAVIGTTTPAGPAIGAIDMDFNFNPMFKLSLGNDAPKVGYALGLTPIYIGANTRNPATTFAGANGFVWGNSTAQPGLSIRGTTNPSTGLGLNYIVGYLTGAPGPAVAAPNADPVTFYGHVGYFIDGINSNIGIGYASENNGLANTNAGTQLLVDFAYNVGENFMATVTYNQVKGALATNATQATINAGTITNICIQPEFAISSTLSVGGRYATSQSAATGALTTSTLSVGGNYKLLQNILAWGNYTSISNGGTNTVGGTLVSSSSLQAGLDFIF